MTPTTEIILVDGSRHRVDGGPEEVEKRILDAARGSLLELAWLTAADSGEPLGVNPEHVVMLRGLAT